MADVTNSGEYGRGALREANERAGIGLLSRFLGAVFLVLVCGLLLLDRALLRANESQAELDAQSAALLVESFLSAREVLLTRIQDRLRADRQQKDTTETGAAIRQLLADAPDVRRIWSIGASGIADIAPGGPHQQIAATTRQQLDSLRAFGTNGVFITSIGPAHTLISLLNETPGAQPGREPVLALAFDSDDMRATLARARADTRVALSVMFGDDTVTVIGQPSATTEALTSSTHVVRLPSGGTWSVTATHALTTRSLRWAIWALGILGALFLAYGLLREQQRAIQASSRSLELERLYRDVKLANQAKSEFLANVSHELRTPLNAIVGFVELLREGFYGDLEPRQASPVNRIAASATHLRHLVDQILDIAKIAAGRMEIQAERVVLRAFVLNVASEVESLLNEKKLAMSISVGGSLPRVQTDPTHLRQILINLIANAVKFTPAGTITVRAKLVDGLAAREEQLRQRASSSLLQSNIGRAWLALQVADTGIGISAADQERIFEEFEQVNAGPRGDSMNRGTGLGLPISRRLARLLGGDITVESEVGQGATFTLWLPVSAEELARSATSVEIEVPDVSA